MMDEKRFGELIAAFGAEPSRWPQNERAPALAFTRDHPEIAARLRKEAEALDGLLEAARTAPPPTRLEQAILAAAQAETRFAPSWARLAAVLALSAGLGLGWSGASLRAGGSGDAAYAMAFSSFEEPAFEALTDFLQDEVR